MMNSSNTKRVSPAKRARRSRSKQLGMYQRDAPKQEPMPALNLDSRLTIPIPVCPSSARQPGWPMSYLYSGASFTGHQRSRGDVLRMEVHLTQVDLEKSELNGHMTIHGLTRENPTLTTYFSGEIVSARYPFLTRKWDANEGVDASYWGKFSHFCCNLAGDFNKDTFDYDRLQSMDHVYMRWKEHFFINPAFTKQRGSLPAGPSGVGVLGGSSSWPGGLVLSPISAGVMMHNANDIFGPLIQPRTSAVPGVSIDGFYYVCLDKRNGTIEGTYFHSSYNIYLTLNLTPEPQRSIPVYQIR